MQGGYTRGEGAVGRKSSKASCMPNAGARVGLQAAGHAGGAKAGGEKREAGPAACPTPVPLSASRQLSMQEEYTRGEGAVGRIR